MTQNTHSSSTINISLIVPVYNRPDEVGELLESLSKQTDMDFELMIVEDGSTLPCSDEVKAYEGKMKIKYFAKENTGPGITRNYGYERCTGNYGIFLDSDCIIPPHYIATVKKSLTNQYVDAFGGPDKADESFSILQKAIDYTMTSFITTGGIRSGSKKLDKYYPRSFNMGISREVFESTGGFPAVKFANTKAAGEDIELSIMIYKAGFKIGYIAEAYVYHKRRTSLKMFLRQVFNFGYARVSLSRRNKGTLKMVHLLPLLFTLGTGALLLMSVLFSWKFLWPLMVFSLIVFLDALLKKKSIRIAGTALLTSYIQLIGYGCGFISGWWEQCVLKKENI